MNILNPDKLHVNFLENLGSSFPRTYTLTHSDSTGDLFLSIGSAYNIPQISGWYTRFMRDEVLAEWRFDNQHSLHVHCHISGGIIFGLASWRRQIFRNHMPMVLEAFRYGDQEFIRSNPELDEADVFVHFHTRQASRSQVESWGQFGIYATSNNNFPETDRSGVPYPVSHSKKATHDKY